MNAWVLYSTNQHDVETAARLLKKALEPEYKVKIELMNAKSTEPEIFITKDTGIVVIGAPFMGRNWGRGAAKYLKKINDAAKKEAWTGVVGIYVVRPPELNAGLLKDSIEKQARKLDIFPHVCRPVLDLLLKPLEKKGSKSDTPVDIDTLDGQASGKITSYAKELKAFAKEILQEDEQHKGELKKK
nr:hypothetical protein [Candidatus Sigynarchaeota archaeon]